MRTIDTSVLLALALGFGLAHPAVASDPSAEGAQPAGAPAAVEEPAAEPGATPPPAEQIAKPDLRPRAIARADLGWMAARDPEVRARADAYSRRQHTAVLLGLGSVVGLVAAWQLAGHKPACGTHNPCFDTAEDRSQKAYPLAAAAVGVVSAGLAVAAIRAWPDERSTLAEAAAIWNSHHPDDPLEPPPRREPLRSVPSDTTAWRP